MPSTRVHTLFLDGNPYSNEFDVFDGDWDNVVFACHDYSPAGLGFGGPCRGETRGAHFDREAVERKFLQRSEFSRRTGTPVWVGEFGVIRSEDPTVDEQRYQLLADQLDIHDTYDAGWSLWMYEDLGRQGLAGALPDSAYRRRFDALIAKKVLLGADQSGSTDRELPEVVGPPEAAFATHFPDSDPYPWGSWGFLRTVVLNIALAQPLVQEYADRFRGLDA